MKMYLTSSGTYFATQDEAKKHVREFGGSFEPEDVPIKLRELVEYLNARRATFPVAQGYVGERSAGNDIVVDGNNTPPRQPAANGQSYTDLSVSVDVAWEGLSLSRKLDFAALAMQSARDEIPHAVPQPEPVGNDLL